MFFKKGQIESGMWIYIGIIFLACLAIIAFVIIRKVLMPPV